MIAEPLRALLVDIDTLHTMPGNPRVGDVDAIARSLEQFGQRKPIVGRSDGTITAGNHTLLAARSLHWPQIAAVLVDDDDETAKAYALADNRTAELGGYDDEALLAMIADITDAELLAATAWQPDDVAALVKRIDTSAALLVDKHIAEPFAVFARDDVIAEAFAHYRQVGFPYRRLTRLDCMQQINALAATDDDALISTTTAYHVADSYHPHRMNGHAEMMRSPIDSFASDKQLLRALRLCLDMYGGTINDQTLFNALSLVAGTQACSNFRPGFALALYREFVPNDGVVLDTSTGYGGRLVAFLASTARTYIGIDPSSQTHAANMRLADELATHKNVELLQEPAEDVDVNLFAACADFAFTSPPYFSKEHYADEATQSFKRYPEATAWRDNFLLPMMKLQHAALKPGAYALVNIADVELRNRTFPLEGWLRDCAATAGFECLEVRRFPMPRAFAVNETRDAFEPVFVFRKRQ